MRSAVTRDRPGVAGVFYNVRASGAPDGESEFGAAANELVGALEVDAPLRRHGLYPFGREAVAEWGLAATRCPQGRKRRARYADHGDLDGARVREAH